MGSIAAASAPQPPPSALHRFLAAHPPPPALPAAQRDHHALALQIAHNLRFQHNWSDVRLHLYAPALPLPTAVKPSFPPSSSPTPALPPSQAPRSLLPRPLLSGLPPRRLYVHPDEQLAQLQRQKDAERLRGAAAVSTAKQQQQQQQPPAEREWVLPSHLREKWSLQRLGAVFDAVTLEPPRAANGGTDADGEGEAMFARREPREFGLGASGAAVDVEKGGKEDTRDEGLGPEGLLPADGGSGGSSNSSSSSVETDGANAWRTSQPKRLVLATLDDDSTVVYYIVHDGIVKPRQN